MELPTYDSIIGPQSDGDAPVFEYHLDAGVTETLPKGARVVSSKKFGSSAWSSTGLVEVQLSDGTRHRYFMKSACGEAGRVLVEGEYHALNEMHKAAPGVAPEPYTKGEYRYDNPIRYFVLTKFTSMENVLPNPARLCSKLVRLHRQSVSPTGKFGFEVPTCQGRTAQALSWESSWTQFFTNLLTHVTRLDFEVNGPWDELEALEKRIFSHVIPRLIGVLEADGRKIKPCLIHGNLWEGNTGTARETGEVYIFDPASYFAHHEMEIGDWRCHYNKIHNRIYTKTYFQLEKPSEPREEWDDRNRMYCIYFNVIFSVNHTNHGKAIRQQAYHDMYYLIDKYAPFPPNEGPPRLMPSDWDILPQERDHAQKATKPAVGHDGFLSPKYSSVHYQPVESKKLEVVDMLATEPMRYKSPPYMRLSLYLIAIVGFVSFAILAKKGGCF